MKRQSGDDVTGVGGHVRSGSSQEVKENSAISWWVISCFIEFGTMLYEMPRTCA